VTDPDGARWEWYVKTGDAEQLSYEAVEGDGGAVCCAPAEAVAEPVTLGRTAEPASSGGCC